MKLLLFLLTILIINSKGFSQDIFVSTQSGSDVSGTGKMSEPFKSIKKAIEEIKDETFEIHLQNGRYFVPETINLTGQGKISGGYGKEWDLSQNQTIVQGNHSNPVFFCETFNGEIKNIQIEKGKSALGGGVHIWNSPNVLLEKCIIQKNIGTGIYIEKSSVSISSCSISFNLNGYEGGGVFAEQSDISLINNLIYKNSAVSGGGIFLNECSFIMANNTICKNQGDGFALRRNPSNGIGLNNIIIKNTPQNFVSENESNISMRTSLSDSETILSRGWEECFKRPIEFESIEENNFRIKKNSFGKKAGLSYGFTRMVPFKDIVGKKRPLEYCTIGAYE